jgi:hypothetical protein
MVNDEVRIALIRLTDGRLTLGAAPTGLDAPGRRDLRLSVFQMASFY